MHCEPLEYLPPSQWTELQQAFQSNWPRGISGYTILETQKRWIQEKHDYGFKVFCPSGNIWNGMVAVNQKGTFYELVIQSPKDDTRELEEALKKTNLINWKRNIIIPYAPSHIIECVKKIVDHVNVNIDLILPSESLILEKQTTMFENIRLSPEIHFGLLSHEHIDLVDSNWPHRYPDSTWYFQLLINNGSGYGLFKGLELVSWVFINEAGTLGHMYTLKEFRRQGLAKALLKLVCNILLKEGKDVFAFCVKENTSACSVYQKVGFVTYDSGVAWCYLKNKEK